LRDWPYDTSAAESFGDCAKSSRRKCLGDKKSYLCFALAYPLLVSKKRIFYLLAVLKEAVDFGTC
jgi:hypothetical protein